jgi:tRNA-specific 2-thiouridylase
MSKSETRALALRFALPVAAKPDSQDICFVPSGRYADVVRELRPEAGEPGEIVDLDGAVVGHHHGIVDFTVGQRRGLGIGARAGADQPPLYVVRIEPEARRVVVGPRAALMRDRVTLRDVNWLGDSPFTETGASVKLRSTCSPAPATVRPLGGGAAEASLHEPQAGIAPGQACVFYDGERVLGGGWIVDAELTGAVSA